MKFSFVMCILEVLLILASGAKIKLYKDIDSTDLLYELNLTDNGCVNFPRDKNQDLRSIITDTCFMAYIMSDCVPKMSYKYMPGKTLITSDRDAGYSISAGWINSLHLCNDQEGGPQLNVDLTTFINNQYRNTVPHVLENYDNICTCVNVPKYVQDMSKWSIDNHGNGLFAYYEPDCKNTIWHLPALYIDIEAGLWHYSWNMHAHKRLYRGIPYKIQSIGPDMNSTYFSHSCSSHRYDQTMKLELLEALNCTSSQVDANLNMARIDLTTGANDDILHFIADTDFQGYHFGSRSRSKCSNFPKPVENRWVNGIGSIKTKVCVILYPAFDCMERIVKIEVPGTTNLTSLWESTVTGQRTLSLLYTQHPNWKWETKSYRVCNKEEGGSSLKVDILSSDPTVEPVNGPVILESYPHLCSCRNVAECIQQLETWFINNHGNALLTYFSADCSSTTFSPLWIPAGQSSYSFGLGSFKHVDPNTGIIHKIQSFAPDPNSGYFKKSCNNNFTRENGASICDYDIANENTLVGLLCTQVIGELQHISRKVDELKQIDQQVGFNFEIFKPFIEDKLQNQKDEFKNLKFFLKMI